jgi:hypothetical protein
MDKPLCCAAPAADEERTYEMPAISTMTSAWSVVGLVLVCAAVWLLARLGQRWIDRTERRHPGAMRTGDAQQIERDIEQPRRHHAP